MRRTGRCAAVVLGCAALLACEEPGTGPEVQTVLFPLEVGNQWTYEPENLAFGEPFEWTVAERTGDTVLLSRPPAGSHPGPVQLLDDIEEIGLVDQDGGVLPFYRFSPGETWTHRDPWECDDGLTFRAVEEPNPVVTPAGTFENTLRIERMTTASCTDAGTMVEWWAPDVGLVRWEELNFYAGGPLTFYLTDYSVGG